MKITWEIDSFSLGLADQYTTIVDDEDLANCESDEEKETLIELCIQHDLLQQVTWIEVRRET